MTWNSDGSNFHQAFALNLSQAQAQELPCEPFSEDWQWPMDTRPASTPVWNAVSSSEAMHMAMPTHYFDPNMLSNDAGNVHSTSVKGPSPNLNLNYPSGHSVNVFNLQTDRSRPGGPSMPFQLEARYMNKEYEDGVYHHGLRSQSPVYPQTTSRKTRKPKQPQDIPPAQSLRCNWEGCSYSGSFKRESLLIRHLKKLHFYPGSHPCPIQDCNMVCNRADNLMQHMRNVHS